MTKYILISIFATCAFLTACTAKDTVYRAPDETQVVKQKALTLPPDYELRPPLPAKKADESKADKKDNE